VYFVIARRHTRRQAASTAINTLRAAGANVLGAVVVNG
jgi:Mrp family chromosome partitioning ATPase